MNKELTKGRIKIVWEATEKDGMWSESTVCYVKNNHRRIEGFALEITEEARALRPVSDIDVQPTEPTQEEMEFYLKKGQEIFDKHYANEMEQLPE